MTSKLTFGRVLAGALVGLSLSCSSAPKRIENGALIDKDYQKLVKQHTRSTDQYSGLYQTFQADATLLTSALQTEMVQRRAAFQQWSEAKTQQERDRAFQIMASSTLVFLRFFSPEGEVDDLHLPKSIWKIYLEKDGTRYEGRVRKMGDKLVEIRDLFPHFDRFSTPYEVSFNLPTAAAEAGMVKVILTSSLGSAEFQF